MTHDKKLELLDALNLIDEQAEQMGGTLEERQKRTIAYDLLFNAINTKL